MAQRQTQDIKGTEQHDKGLIEKLFPSVYALWRIIGKSRVADAKKPQAPKPTPRQSPAQANKAKKAAAQKLPDRLPQVGEAREPELQEAQIPPSRQAQQPSVQSVNQPTDIPGRPIASAGKRPKKSFEKAAPESAATGFSSARFEIEETTGKACEELKSVLGARAEAADIRQQAQRALDEAETMREEAERTMAQASQILATAVAINPKILRSMGITVRTLEEAIRTERQLRQVTRQHAEEEAEWARKRATDAILNAISAVTRARSYVSRELEEARRTATIADSLENSSQNDLRRAHAIMSEADSLMRREAGWLLEQPLTSDGTPETSTVSSSPPLEQKAEQEAPYKRLIRDRVTQPEPGRSPEVEADIAVQPTGGEPPSAPVSREAQPGPPPVHETVEPPPEFAVWPEQPIASQDRQGIESAGDLETALSEFVGSAEGPEATPTTGEAPATPSPKQEAPVTSDVAGPLGQPPTDQDPADIGSADELQAALNEFIGSVENQEAAPGAILTPELPDAQQEKQLQPDVPMSLEQPQFSQKEQVPASTDELEGALNQFLGEIESREVTPVVEAAGGSSVPQDKAGTELDNTGFEELASSPVGPPASELTPTDDLQAALNEFLGSVEKIEADFSNGEPLGPVPQNEKGEAMLDTNRSQNQPTAGGPEQPDIDPADDLQEALNEFLATGTKSGNPPKIEDQPGPSKSQEEIEWGLNLSELNERPAASQDQPEIEFTDDLQAALNDFLGSVDKPEAATAGIEDAGLAPASGEGLFLDTFDFSDSEPDGGHSQDVTQGKKPDYVAPGTPSPIDAGHVENDFLAELEQTLASFNSGPTPAESPTIEAAKGQQVPHLDGQGDSRQGQPTGQPQDSSSVKPMPIAESYSGILYIVFTPSPDPIALSRFWDIVDAVAGVGKVIAQSPLPDGSGDEFTLDLGDDALAMNLVTKQIPNADIKALGMDRLRIQLAPITP